LQGGGEGRGGGHSWRDLAAAAPGRDATPTRQDAAGRRPPPQNIGCLPDNPYRSRLGRTDRLTRGAVRRGTLPGARLVARGGAPFSTVIF